MNTQIERQRGFTLVEMIMVIVITGVIAGVVAIFIRSPVQSYFDMETRVELTDTADTALRRIGRDLRLALPNSVRIIDNTTIEFLQTRAGGRYRTDVTAAGAGDALVFNAADASFDILGPPMTFAAGDQIVIYNLGIPGADAYAGNTLAVHNRRAYNGLTGVAVTTVTMTSANPLPFDSPARRFHVVDTPVTYRCNGGTLTRHWGYAITAAQANPPVGGQSALIAQNVSACTFTYAPLVNDRSGLVSMQIALTRNNETVTLYHEVHVSNVP
jgi:MSHA biogenesis protein MshO